MSQTITAHDRMTDAYILMSDQLPLDTAATEIRNSSEPYGVLSDSAGTPQGLITVDILERALQQIGEEQHQLTLAEALRWLPPLLTTRAETPLALVVAQPWINLLNRGVAGAVVVDEQGVVGILTGEAIATYLAIDYQPTGRLAGSTLPGVIITEPGKQRCGVCNYPNEIDVEIDVSALPQCQNPSPPMGKHQITLPWLHDR